MMHWQQVVDLALQLPGSEACTSYGRPAIKVRKKMFACTGKAEDHFLVITSREEKLALIDNHPTTFFQTPHYENSNAVLIRYETADKDLVEVLLQRAWHRRASNAQRQAFEAD